MGYKEPKPTRPSQKALPPTKPLNEEPVEEIPRHPLPNDLSPPGHEWPAPDNLPSGYQVPNNNFYNNGTAPVINNTFYLPPNFDPSALFSPFQSGTPFPGALTPLPTSPPPAIEGPPSSQPEPAPTSPPKGLEPAPSPPEELDRSTNPGFCDYAWEHRQQSLGRQFPPRAACVQCRLCGINFIWICGSKHCRRHGKRNMDPEVKVPGQMLIPRTFQYQSHMPATARNHRPRYGCLICFEVEGKELVEMETKEWIKHIEKHFEDGYEECQNYWGHMQPRSDCRVLQCHRIHC